MNHVDLIVVNATPLINFLSDYGILKKSIRKPVRISDIPRKFGRSTYCKYCTFFFFFFSSFLSQSGLIAKNQSAYIQPLFLSSEELSKHFAKWVHNIWIRSGFTTSNTYLPVCWFTINKKFYLSVQTAWLNYKTYVCRTKIDLAKVSIM